ncbi:MAG: hypothetical protein GY804_15250 [Alphaproteobacteria bacterium]|nr:hypothetical protein [Alphaproteobacteria bacterium]
MEKEEENKNSSTEDKKGLGKKSTTIFAAGFCLVGIIGVFCPDFFGQPGLSHSHVEMYTFGRIVGWIAINLGLLALSGEYKAIEEYSEKWFGFKFFVTYLSFISIISGFIGMVTRKSYNFHAIYNIRDPFMYAMEFVYFTLGLILLLNVNIIIKWWEKEPDLTKEEEKYIKDKLDKEN